ncbi:hypothetical protein M0R45_019532 [Rubus argutus]|uniref:Uncharacterized protein n=1 Tax=Rubus argutus TaxID=59490 RepID=A0AAW1X7M0_RUBAR
MTRLGVKEPLPIIGSDAIYIAADGRGCFTLLNDDGLILARNVKKIVKISDKIVITLAGRSDLLFEMVKIAKKSVIGGSMISWKESVKNFRKSWRKKNGSIEFPASILICGWNMGRKTIIKVDAYETKSVYEIDSCSASGWGEDVAEGAVKQMVEGQHLIRSEKYIQCVSQAIIVSAMGANYTGGEVMTSAACDGGEARQHNREERGRVGQSKDLRWRRRARARRWSWVRESDWSDGRDEEKGHLGLLVCGGAGDGDCWN